VSPVRVGLGLGLGFSQTVDVLHWVTTHDHSNGFILWSKEMHIRHMFCSFSLLHLLSFHLGSEKYNASSGDCHMDISGCIHAH
jgi:hypothetical protein